MRYSSRLEESQRIIIRREIRNKCHVVRVVQWLIDNNRFIPSNHLNAAYLTPRNRFESHITSSLRKEAIEKLHELVRGKSLRDTGESLSV